MDTSGILSAEKEGRRVGGVSSSQSKNRGVYSDRMLELAQRFVEANDVPADPAELGYVRCSRCGRWIPEGTACACDINKR